ncbi:MAG: metalloregulator ArsR/SmtB family transcription factor [Deltaproteobacteria bacterium]
MHTIQNLAIMKALADKSRLAIVNSLLERSQYVEELAKRHALAPSTVSFHLRKLEQAGLIRSRKVQYYVIVEINEAMFDTTLRQLVAESGTGKELQEQRIGDYRRKVLDSFFRHGRLEKLPAQHKKRLIVLERFAALFKPQRRYSETEVTGLIMPLYDDYCAIRRLLVDEGLVRREGNTYWREENVVVEQFVTLPEKSRKGEGKMQKDKRKEIKQALKLNPPQIGIYQIRCKSNGKLFIAASQNLEGERNSRLFQLRMGKIVFNRELQRDLTQYGAAAFEFSVLAVLDPPQPGEDREKQLQALELHWLEQLQPFGARGYNSEKAYQRNRERLQLKQGC